MRMGNGCRISMRTVFVSVAVIAMLVLGACGSAVPSSPGSTGSKAASATVAAKGTRDVSFDEALKAALAYARGCDIAQGEGYEWTALSLARADDQASTLALAGFADAMEERVKASQGKISNHKSTEYSKAVLSLTAVGDDARNIAGYNLLEGLADLDFVTMQGVNGPIWALIAVDSKSEYDIPPAQTANPSTREALLQAVLGSQGADGGWRLDAEASGQGDVDLTAMALMALATDYAQGGNEAVNDAVERALAFLSSVQQADGSFATKDGASSESASQVIVALCSLGIDPDTDERFVKGGSSVLDNLLTFQDVKTGGFSHEVGGNTDGMASDQGLEALVALKRLRAGQSALFDMNV